MAGKIIPREDGAAADTWVSPVPASVAPRAMGDEHAGFDARSAARVIDEPNVRVIRAGGQGVTGEPEDGDAAEASTTFSVGTLLDSRYHIERFIGRGGMGEVYEAHDQLMDRRVALKTILRSVADRCRAARRFKAEVRNAQRVAHPHVCRIHDLHEHHYGGADAALPFFTMELIDGERLGERLSAGALPLGDVRIIASQLLGGLAAAHARGVLHLDFKSDNIMLRHVEEEDEPEAVITDFGLSRVLGDPGGLRTSDRRQFAGTLPYMSIEQLECRESLGPATDVYAFGVVLYEMLTRALPFPGESLGAVLMKQLNERPLAPSRCAPGLVPALDRFVLRCLNREPRERFSDAGAALAALNAMGEWTRPTATLARWRAAWPAAALIAAGAALLSARWEGPTAPAPQREILQVAAELAPAPSAVPALANDSARTNDPALAPSAPAGSPGLDSSPRGDVAVVPALAPIQAPRGTDPPHALPPGAVALPAPQRASVRSVGTTGSPGVALPSVTAARPAPSSPSANEAALRGDGTPGAADATDGWKPTRVPKRLSVALEPPSDDSQNRPR